MKNNLAIAVVAALVVSGPVYGQSKSNTSNNKNQTKKVLRDNQMDGVTAAGEESSALAANNSRVTENNSGTVDISGSVLNGAKGVNIVNSTDALVGNGVNVYNGSLTTQANNGGANVKQGNEIGQSSAREATLSDYSRGKDSQLAVSSASDVTKSSSSSSSLDASLNKTWSNTETRTDNRTSAHSSTQSLNSTRTSAATASASRSASENETSSAANTASRSNSSNDTSSYNATTAAGSSGIGGSSTSNGNSTHTNSGTGGGATSTTAGGQSNTLGTTGIGTASNSTTGRSTTDAEASAANSAAQRSNSASATNAAQQAAAENNASTYATQSAKNNTYTHNQSNTETNSRAEAASLSEKQAKSSAEHSVKSYDKTYDVQGAVSFDNASAQNVAVDGSTISATNAYKVTLAGSAMQNATAMNIVNAAGGMVANGVNVARTSNMNSTPTLTQYNSISQVR